MESKSKLNALEDILDYVKRQVSKQEFCYSVTWKLNENNVSRHASHSDLRKADASQSQIQSTSASPSPSKNKNGLVTSYFYASDIFNLLDKFYYDKNREDFIIYEIKCACIVLLCVPKNDLVKVCPTLTL